MMKIIAMVRQFVIEVAGFDSPVLGYEGTQEFDWNPRLSSKIHHLQNSNHSHTSLLLVRNQSIY